MKLSFIKMQGAGNDYIFIDGERYAIENPEALAREMSARRLSVGADGLVILSRTEESDIRMRIFNSDGSEGLMCGNALRCAAALLHAAGKRGSRMSVVTASGVRGAEVLSVSGKRSFVRAYMGEASFNRGDIGIDGGGEYTEERTVTDAGVFTVTGVSVGNPHAVIFDDGESPEVSVIGKALERSGIFKGGINTELVRVTGARSVEATVYERGSGVTLSCGTGACACVAAAVKTGRIRAGEDIKVSMPGGELYVYCSDGWEVYLSGEVREVFSGEYETEGAP